MGLETSTTRYGFPTSFWTLQYLLIAQAFESQPKAEPRLDLGTIFKHLKTLQSPSGLIENQKSPFHRLLCFVETAFTET